MVQFVWTLEYEITSSGGMKMNPSTQYEAVRSFYISSLTFSIQAILLEGTTLDI